jgi:hypothetical protein
MKADTRLKDKWRFLKITSAINKLANIAFLQKASRIHRKGCMDREMGAPWR